MGTIHASELIRSLLKSSRPSGLAQAIMEVGRVNKTRKRQRSTVLTLIYW
ncbi:Tn3 family transposase [Escherichia coli]|nr:Tn3 family transposase [Escherichia coli]